MKELSLEAKLESLDEVLAFVDQQLEEMGCSIKTQMQIDVAVEELYVNVAHYAYAPGTGPIKILLEEDQDPPAIYITFIDHGIPYNPLAKEDPDVTLSAEKRSIGGLGIYMVKKSMDEMTYNYLDGQNIVRIKKILG